MATQEAHSISGQQRAGDRSCYVGAATGVDDLDRVRFSGEAQPTKSTRPSLPPHTTALQAGPQGGIVASWEPRQSLSMLRWALVFFHPKPMLYNSVALDPTLSQPQSPDPEARRGSAPAQLHWGFGCASAASPGGGKNKQVTDGMCVCGPAPHPHPQHRAGLTHQQVDGQLGFLETVNKLSL